MASKLITFITFVAGFAVGAGVIYLEPPVSNAGLPSGMAPGPAGAGAPPPGQAGAVGKPPPSQVGAQGAPPPGQVGTQGAPAPDHEPAGPATADPSQTSPAAAFAQGPPRAALDQGPSGVPGADVVGPPGGGTPMGTEGGGLGLPLAPDAKPGPVIPVSVEQTGGARRADWLDTHLDSVRPFWLKQAQAAEDAGGAAAALAPRMRDLAENVPAHGQLAPPLALVVTLLYKELSLYDDMKAAGMDVSAVEIEIEGLLRVR